MNEHKNGHQHDHDHHHHGHHHHGEAEEIANKALVYSGTKRYCFETPCSCGQLTDRLVGAFRELSRSMQTEGIIPGHLKAVLLLEDHSGYSVSATRSDIIDCKELGQWDAGKKVTCCEATVDLLNLFPVQFNGELFMENLFVSRKS